MEIDPVGSPTERYYGNLDVPDGGYAGNEDGLPLIIFDYANEALQFGGTNLLGAGNITATGLDIAGVGTFDKVVIDGTVTIGLDMSAGTFSTAIQKWPAGTIQSTGDIVFQPTSDGTTRYQWLNAAGDATVLNIDTVNEQVGINTDNPISTVGGLDIASGGIGLVVGAVNNSNARTDSTSKISRIAVPHYLNAEEPVAILRADSTATDNIGYFGGGSVILNTLTEVRFYTAANTTTTTGTKRLRITSSGKIIQSNTLNSLSGSNVDVSELSHVINNPGSDTGEAIGIGFGLSSEEGNIGAAIIHERVGGNSQGNLHFATKLSTASVSDIPIRATISFNGNLGLNELLPETLLELTHAQPWWTTHNSTHNNDNLSRLSRWFAKGEKFDGTEHTLTITEVGHDGTGDDFGAYWKLSLHTKAEAGADTLVDRIKADELGVYLGDGGVTSYMKVETDGDTYWVGPGSGLVYGYMYTNNQPVAVTLTTQNTWYELDGANAWTTGLLNNCSFTDPAITVLEPGVYEITWTLSTDFSTTPGAAQQIEFGIMIDGAIQNEGQAHRTLQNSTDTGHCSGTALLDLADNAVISLAARNQTSGGKIIHVEHGNMTVKQIGGT